MKLRDHPLMSYRTAANWPPIWVWRGQGENKRPKDEIGILKQVMPYAMPPSNKCFLVVDHEGAEYMGCLLFADPGFCRDIHKLLLSHLGDSIEQIGDVDVSHTL
jgi:hypothetical protein